MIVIGWLNTTPSRLKTFVRHRIGEIQDSNLNNRWSYVLNENIDNFENKKESPRLIAQLEYVTGYLVRKSKKITAKFVRYICIQTILEIGRAHV